MQVLSKRLLALPSYFGGKRKLLSWSFGQLNQLLPQKYWSGSSFADAFLGGGAPSLYAKAQNFKNILCNDCSDRSSVVANSILLNEKTKLDVRIVYNLLLNNVEDRITKNQGSSVLTKRHAIYLDQLSIAAQQQTNQTKKALLQLLIWHLVNEFTTFPTSIGNSNKPYVEVLEGQRDWQSLPQKRLTDGSFQRLLRPTLSIIERKIESINNGVFGGNQVQFTQLDVMDFFKQYSADILFLDPPYSHTKDYNQANAVLDDILFGENVSQIKSRLNFNNAEGSLNAMFESARHFPIWILTYGNNDIDRDGLKRLVQSHVPHRKVIARSRLFKHLPHVSKKSDNQELLIIAAEKGLCHV